MFNMKEKSFPYKELGARIELLRLESGIAVKALCTECGFSNSRYYEVIRGQTCE